MGKKYDNPLKNPVFMKDFIFLMSRKDPEVIRKMLINCLADISNFRQKSFLELKRKYVIKLVYLIGSFLFVLGLLNSIREYLR
jgi:hypothetical protein